MKTLKGSICISRPSYGSGKEDIVISVTDELSRVQFLEFHIDLADFARAVTGLGCIKGEMEIRGLEYVGMTSEHKTERVPRDIKCYSRDVEKAKAALKPFEVDGWVGSVTDYLNHHNWTGDKALVSFKRHVKTQE